MKNNRLSRFAIPYVIWMALFVVAPIIMVVIYAFSASVGGFTLDNFAKMGTYTVVFTRSFKLALIATAICVLIGYPVSYKMSKEGPRFQRLAMVLIMLPMWMNFLLRTLAWQTLLEKNGVINSILSFLHLPQQSIINTPAAIVLGMVYNFLPFMVLPIYNSLIKIPQDTFDAAKDLGANWIQTLWRITLPQILPGIVSGITMVFVPAMTTFVISNLLGGAKINLIGNVIEQEFTTANNWYGGAGLSIVLMILILGSMAVMSHFDKEGEGAAIW